MIFTPEQAIEKIKQNLKVSKDFLKMREYSKELKSLVNGENFIDELINKIEHIESENKAKARKLYSRDVKGLFTRLFQPIDNIYYATGGIKDYSKIKEANQKTFLSKIANVRDNRPLSKWVQDYAIKLFNTDPNGLIFLEYKTITELDIYPTYKSIDKIRYYKSKGQILDYLIFEPKTYEQKTFWRFVDDVNDYTFEQIGNEFILKEDLTFSHPFGQVPAVICSNITKPAEKCKLAAIDGVIETSKEYARDQSFLTLYKIYKGNPIFWKYVQYCADCNGTGKSGEDNCSSCNGHGKIVSKSDVTDAVELPIPNNPDVPILAPNIAGYISPDYEVWAKYEETLKSTEEEIYKTHWGTNYGMQNVSGVKTATEVTFDKQPLENQLNKYADFVEFIEWKLSEWILNFYDNAKKKEESQITISLGRRYIIESYDVLLERYEKSVEKGENSVVLDKLFVEYLSAKYRNNPIDLNTNLIKARIEPYLHLPVSQVLTIFGNEEAQRKVLFQKWWQSITDYSSDEVKLLNEFNTWFESNKKPIQTTKE